MIKMFLLKGFSVTYLSRGSSLDPLVKSGDECTFDPIYDINLVHQHDVVVCEPHKNWLLVQKVLWIAPGETGRKSDKWFAIANENGHLVAWAKGHQLYGRLALVRSAR